MAVYGAASAFARDASADKTAAPYRRFSFAHVFTVDAAELAQQLLRSLVEEARQHDLDFYDEVAALAVAGRRRPAAAHAEFLSRLRAWRHPQPRASVGRRHFDFCSQRRLVHRDRHDDVNIVAFPTEQVALLHLDRDVEIPDAATAQPGVPFFGDSDARAVRDTGRHANGDRLGPRVHAQPRAGHAGGAREASHAFARLAGF